MSSAKDEEIQYYATERQWHFTKFQSNGIIVCSMLLLTSSKSRRFLPDGTNMYIVTVSKYSVTLPIVIVSVKNFVEVRVAETVIVLLVAVLIVKVTEEEMVNVDESVVVGVVYDVVVVEMVVVEDVEELKVEVACSLNVVVDKLVDADVLVMSTEQDVDDQHR